MGYVKLNRDIVDSEIFLDDKLLAFYVRLLLFSRFRPRCDHGILVGSGQLLTSVRKLGTVLNSKSTNTHKLLNALEEKHLITIEKYSRGSLITIVNYNCEKNYEQKREQQIKCSREHFANTLRTPTLLYKKEKNDEQGVGGARLLDECAGNSADNGSENHYSTSELNYEDLGDGSEKDPQNSTDANNCGSPKNFNAADSDLRYPTRESLVEKYGEENVREYEARFERWKLRQKRTVSISCYEAIERWMRDDKIQKLRNEAAFSTDEIMRRIINSYND